MPKKAPETTTEANVKRNLEESIKGILGSKYQKIVGATTRNEDGISIDIADFAMEQEIFSMSDDKKKRKELSDIISEVFGGKIKQEDADQLADDIIKKVER